MPRVDPVPQGFHTLTPYLVADDAQAVIDFATKAFGATPVHRPTMRPDGKIMYAALQIGDSRLMIGSSSEHARAMPAMLYVYVPDVDAVYAAAVKAGGTSFMTPTDMFYGDRFGGVTDSAGNQWCISTHIEDVPEEELQRRATKMWGKG